MLLASADGTERYYGTRGGGQQAFPVIFLPGILMPAALRYAPLLAELGDSVQAVTKDLEVYETGTPPEHHTIEDEVEGIARAADAAGFERFHLYGHSGGGACALAYVATYPKSVLSLAVDEPVTDFSPQHRAQMQDALQRFGDLSPSEHVRDFVQWQLAPGVALPAPPSGPSPDWMANRPAGINSFMNAILRYRLDPERLRAYHRPVYYSYGTLSSPEWQAMRDRLAALFPDFEAERYEGASHLNTSHQREPARVASALRRLWKRSTNERPEKTAGHLR
jgi:pimeloyl-ACP methyl ester carboxylesterase